MGGACWGSPIRSPSGAHRLLLAATGKHQRALVVGVDIMSSITDYTERTTCMLFGDGAGAVIIEPAVEEGLEIIGFEHENDGTNWEAMQMPA